MKARRLLAAALALAVLAPAGCSKHEPGKGEARLEVDGKAVVDRRDGKHDTVDGKTTLHPGDRVELREGTGTMALRDGVRMELRAGLGHAANSTLLMGTTPVLESGDLLVAAPRRATVSAAGTTLVVDGGAARVSRALGVGVAAYDGSVRLDSAGIERSVPALREMQVPALGRPPMHPRPLRYQDSDPWDRRFLGAAIDLGRTLEATARIYTGNLRPGEGRTPGFFRLVLPGLDDEPLFVGDLINLERPPGETLVGAAISDLGRRGSFDERWQSVFAFRDQGAEWGLVALDQAVSDTPLLGSIEQAVDASPLTFAAAAPGSVGPGQQPSSPGTTEPPPGQTPTTTPGTPPTTLPPTTPPTVPPLPPVDPITPVLDPVIEPVTDVVSGLIGGLLDTPPPPPGG